MTTTIAIGWPEEYAGPRDILGPGHIPWAGSPQIIQTDNGRYVWTARPQFINEQVFDDFMNLRDEGWEISIRSSGDRLRIAIREAETP